MLTKNEQFFFFWKNIPTHSVYYGAFFAFASAKPSATVGLFI